MKKYLAFLRGINVGGHKKIKMADLRILLEQEGFSKVTTYIQSGNIVFTSKVEPTVVLKNKIASILKNAYKFDVPVVVRTAEQLQKVVEDNPFTNSKDLAENKLYFALLQQKPDSKNINVLSSIGFENDALVITPTCVYLQYSLGASKAKCTNNFIEQKLKVSATTRNYKTMQKMLALALV